MAEPLEKTRSATVGDATGHHHLDPRRLSDLLAELGVMVDHMLAALPPDRRQNEIAPARALPVPGGTERRIPVGHAAAQFERIYRQRREREKLLGADLFADPAWDLLLDLAVSEAKGRAVSITSACIASGVPPTTALRWIALLEERGLVVRREDTMDRRRAFLELSDKGRSCLKQLVLRMETTGII